MIFAQRLLVLSASGDHRAAGLAGPGENVRKRRVTATRTAAYPLFNDKNSVTESKLREDPDLQKDTDGGIMRIFIIGGIGPIGRGVVQALAKAGHRLTVFHRGKSKPVLPRGVKTLVGERRELNQVIGNRESDVVLDFVCANEHEARETVRVFDGRTNRCVMLSSADVYRAYEILNNRVEGETQLTPLAEGAELRKTRYPCRASLNPLYHYYDKILVEQAVSSCRTLPTTILRVPLTYGVPGMVPYLDAHLNAMLNGSNPVPFDGAAAKWKGCWGYIENVVSAIVAAVTDLRATGRVYNIGDADSSTFLELLQIMREVTRARGDLLAVDRRSLPDELLVAPNPEQNWDLDTSRIRTDLGFTDPFDRVRALNEVLALAGG